jgi:signal transduction histidine kinase
MRIDYLKGRYDLEVVDIYQHPLSASENQIFASPTLIKKLPLPIRKFAGDMAKTDIDQRRRLEEQLARQFNELTITNKELNTFAYSISHDLRVPLTAMKGYSAVRPLHIVFTFQISVS